MEDEPINQNYLIGCDTIENSPSLVILLPVHGRCLVWVVTIPTLSRLGGVFTCLPHKLDKHETGKTFL